MAIHIQQFSTFKSMFTFNEPLLGRKEFLIEAKALAPN